MKCGLGRGSSLRDNVFFRGACRKADACAMVGGQEKARVLGLAVPWLL